MELGIVIDGDGRLGQPAAVTAVAQAADGLGFASVWCVGPWATALAGAVAMVTNRVRIGIEERSSAAADAARAAAGDRVTSVEHLTRWPPGAGDVGPDGSLTPGTYRLDVRSDELGAAITALGEAASRGAAEVVVCLVDDPPLDEALAAYAELGEVVEAATPGW